MGDTVPAAPVPTAIAVGGKPSHFESYLDHAIEIREGSVVFEPRCKLCNHELRSEAEDYWDAKRQNASAVVRFLQDRGFTIDDKSVANHMWKHYEEQSAAAGSRSTRSRSRRWRR